MKVYLSVPMIANREVDRARVLEKAIQDSGNEVSSPWVLGPVENNGGPVNIFERDRQGAEASDAIVADVSQPSIGVGMELMAAFKAHKRIIVVAKRGSKVSRMLMHMDGKEMVEFAGEKELYDKVVDLLRGQRKESESR